jgi:hypothetical protein
MRRMSKAVLAAVLAAALFVGVMSVPAQSASPLGCPSLCLTGGLLGLGGRSAAVSGVSAASAEHRDYSFQWIALDLTEFPPLSVTLTIELHADGNVDANGNFAGTGYAEIYSSSGGYNYVSGVTVDENALTITATGGSYGESLTLAGTVVGAGVASFQADYDYDWEGCGEC